MGAHDDLDSVLDAEREEQRTEERRQAEEDRVAGRCSNWRNHKYGQCLDCGLGMSDG